MRQNVRDPDKRLREHGIDIYEADVRPPERYLMERFITAPVCFDGSRSKPHCVRR